MEPRLKTKVGSGSWVWKSISTYEPHTCMPFLQITSYPSTSLKVKFFKSCNKNIMFLIEQNLHTKVGAELARFEAQPY